MESLIGKKVKYIRINQNNELQKGIGIVHSVFIGPDKRMQVRVHDGLGDDGKPKVYNIDKPAINPTADATKKYVAHVKKISAIADESNAAIRDLAAKANAEIDALNEKYLGKPYAGI